MSDLVTDLLANNELWMLRGPDVPTEKRPTRRVTVVTCMDARIDAPAELGLQVGEAHVVRNAGAIVTDDVERSVLLSQYTLGTRAVLVVGHTDCGLLGHDEAATLARVEEHRGVRPDYALGTMRTVEDGVAAGVQRLRASAVLRHTDEVHGFVLDVESGRLTPVAA